MRCSSASTCRTRRTRKRLAKAVADRFGRIDILINNAAIFYGIDNFNSSFEYLRKIFDVNYFGAWLMCRAVFPYMEKQDSGVGDQPVVERRLPAPEHRRCRTACRRSTTA